MVAGVVRGGAQGRRTRALNCTISSSVSVSLLAMTGIRLTRRWRRRMKAMSIGLSLDGR